MAFSTRDYERAEVLLTTLVQNDNLEPTIQIRASNALALCYMHQARHDQALAYYHRAYESACENRDRAYQGVALINMGMVYHELGDYERALSLTQESLSIFREIGDRLRESYALYEIGNCALHMGRWELAQDHLKQAASLYETLDLTARLANVYWAQGLLHHLLGNVGESERTYRRGLSIARLQEDKTVIPVRNDILWYLGFLYYTQQRYDEALDAYDQAIALARELQRTHSLSMIRYQFGNVFKQQGRLTESRAAYERAIHTIEGLRADTEGEEVKLGLLGTTQQSYEAMVLLCVEERRAEEAFDYVERARSQAFLDGLRQKDPALYEALDQPVATLSEVQAALPDGALLLEYFTTGVVLPGESMINNLPPENAGLREYLTLPPHLFLFALTRDHFELYSIPLDPNVVQPKPGSVSPMRRLLRPRQLAYLYARLLGPVESRLREYDLLYLIPHGPLHYVPWMALRSAAGEYLLDTNGPAIALAPSATILLRNCLGRATGHPGTFLALGYNDEGEEALRYAEIEARFLATLMQGDAWVGGAPKMERLVNHDAPLRWLHISSHGIFRPHSPLDSELRLGANDAPSAREIMHSLDLSVDLVTLSACTSGLTHIVPGDELLGLPRAFLYAGAPTVVCTPWEAADLVALLVMERFYRDIQAGHPPAAALRDAQVAVRNMTGRDLAATLARWRREYPAETSDLELPTIAPQQLDQPLFNDPSHWALFMLIGRPY
ncbi:MAG: CHAT domain-containing protein [Chloroflexota bacterium]|nr:CHAT domain-containing protein [Chloroflexota bacterium]